MISISYIFVQICRRKEIKFPSLYSRPNPPIFLHCVDSRLEEGGNWYSRLHLGPFIPGARLQIGRRLRRSLLNDLTTTSPVAIELEGAIHEFTRLPGVQESTLDLLFQFRKVVLNAPFLKLGEKIVVPFFFFGPGNFCVGDILWPNGIQCGNPRNILVTLAQGRVLRGRLLIQKNHVSTPVIKKGQKFRLGETWHSEIIDFSQKPLSYPWLSLGFSCGPVERVGFRIENIIPSDPTTEILIFEILTNGRLSPREALYESTLALVQKFSSILNVVSPWTTRNFSLEVKKQSKDTKSSFITNSRKIGETEISEQTFYDLFCAGLSRFREPLGIDLGNLHLARETYNELRSLGFRTLGQVLERLAFDSSVFSPSLKKRVKKSLCNVDPYFLLNIFMENNLSLAQTVGRRKTAVANLKLVPGSGKVGINGHSTRDLFSGYPHRLQAIRKPFCLLNDHILDAHVEIKGGGLMGQAKALELALARALLVVDTKSNTKSKLREHFLLTRDHRRKERRKYGLKKARKATQFSKRLSNFFYFYVSSNR
jgi:small subunit ribosomal protein S9